MGCVPSSKRRTDECVGTDDSCDEIICLEVHSKPLKNQHHNHTSLKTSIKTSNVRPRSLKLEPSSPKTNASAEIIAGPVISSIKGENNFKEFDLEYLENNHDLRRRSMEKHTSLQREPLPSTSGSSASSSPGFIPSISQSHELAYEPLRLAPDIENEDKVELSYIRSAVEWRNRHKGKVNMETQLKKRRVEMVCNGAFLQFNEKALKYEIICIDSSLPGLRMPSSESSNNGASNDEPKPSVPANHESKDYTSTISSNDLTRKSSESKLKESSSLPSHVYSNCIKDEDVSKIKPITSSALSSTSDSRKSKGRIIRPDLIIRDLKTNIIVHVEIDEHKHKGYNIANEEIRAKTIAEYFSSKGFKYKRLNFNPNGFDNRIEMAHSFVDFVNCYKGICGVYSIDC